MCSACWRFQGALLAGNIILMRLCIRRQEKRWDSGCLLNSLLCSRWQTICTAKELFPACLCEFILAEQIRVVLCFRIAIKRKPGLKQIPLTLNSRVPFRSHIVSPSKLPSESSVWFSTQYFGVWIGLRGCGLKTFLVAYLIKILFHPLPCSRKVTPVSSKGKNNVFLDPCTFCLGVCSREVHASHGKS